MSYFAVTQTDTFPFLFQFIEGGVFFIDKQEFWLIEQTGRKPSPECAGCHCERQKMGGMGERMLLGPWLTLGISLSLPVHFHTRSQLPPQCPCVCLPSVALLPVCSPSTGQAKSQSLK